jgi:hypothetical protein
MKTFEKLELNCFLELHLTASMLLKDGVEYSCVHDDNEGNPDQCLKISLKKESSGSEVFHLEVPTNHGLRFRNYAGGGSSLQVHNALKILVYASLNNELLLPGFERKISSKAKILRSVDDILNGAIILPPEVFADEKCLPNYFFEIAPHLTTAIAVDGDTHIISEPATELKNKLEGKQHSGTQNPFLLTCKQIVRVPFTMHSYCLRLQLNRAIIESHSHPRPCNNEVFFFFQKTCILQNSMI